MFPPFPLPLTETILLQYSLSRLWSVYLSAAHEYALTKLALGTDMRLFVEDSSEPISASGKPCLEEHRVCWAAAAVEYCSDKITFF